MQWQDRIARSESPEKYDCASGHENHPKCLSRQGSFKIDVIDFDGKHPAHEKVIQSADDVFAYLDYALPLAKGTDEIELLMDVAGTDICPAPLISDLSHELLRMYRFIGGRFPYPGGYLDQLSIYISASAIISNEDNRLTKRATDGQR